ncbi:MAG: hypothetical protein IJ866_03360 [Alphaproteobacteria bacterium]|nr:hypothetical protein [Alphaproteobacteria bacterium]
MKKHLFDLLKRGVAIMCAVCGIVALAACQNPNQTDEPEYDTVTVIDNLVIDENSVPIFPKKAALTTDTARRFSIELPKRCSVDWNNQNVVSVVPEERIEVVRLDTGDKLPDLKVSDYEFKKLTVREALEKLLDGTDISVEEDGELIEKISGTIASGALSDAVELMAKMGRAYYSYDEYEGVIHLTNRAKWLIKMPKNETIIMALLDAMHGADMRNLLVNWQDKTIMFEGNYQTEREVARMIADISSKKYMLAWDIDVYRVYPRTDNPIIWMNLFPAFGDKNIKMSIPGVVGRAVVVGPEINTKTLQEFMYQQANVVLISQGTFAIPNGWQSRFDIGQCGKEERLETDLTIGATAKYGNMGGLNKIDAKIVLRTSNGELSSFTIPSSVGDNYIIVGIPTHSFVTTPETLISPFAELVVFMSPRLISIVDPASVKTTDTGMLVGDALRAFLND